MAKFNFDGWNLKDWAKGTKESLKILVAAVFALAAFKNPAIQAVVGGLSKLVLDSIDYWLSK